MSDTPSTDVLRTFAGRQAFDEERELVYWAAERIEKLERELAQASKDAERYRWLRGQLPGVVDAWNLTRLAVGIPAGDVEIDAAMKKGK